MAEVRFKRDFFDQHTLYRKDGGVQYVPDHIAEGIPEHVGKIITKNSEAPQAEQPIMGNFKDAADGVSVQYAPHVRKFIKDNNVSQDQIAKANIVGTGSGGVVTMEDIRIIAEVEEWPVS